MWFSIYDNIRTPLFHSNNVRSIVIYINNFYYVPNKYLVNFLRPRLLKTSKGVNFQYLLHSVLLNRNTCYWDFKNRYVKKKNKKQFIFNSY